MLVEPQAARFQIENTSDGFRAVIPAQRNWFAILFLIVWMGGWAFGEITVLRQLTNPNEKTPMAFLSFWLAFWTLGGAWAVITVLWQFVGREIITANLSELSRRIEIMSFGRTFTYRASEVRSLRTSDSSANPFTSQQKFFPPFFGPQIGPIVFDYGAQTVRMGQSLEEAEAKLLIRELSSRLPRTAIE